MTRDELEAVIWEHMPFTPLFPVSVARVQAILIAADAYAAGDGDDVTLRRRQVLARDGWRMP